jgi:hypothetical protein
LAEAAPDWLGSLAPREWYQRYGRRIEESRLPKSEAGRKEYAQTVGQDGFALLDALARPMRLATCHHPPLRVLGFLESE